MMRTLGLLLLILITQSISWADSGANTLQDILQGTLRKSEDLAIVESRLKQADASLGVAHSGYYPQINLTQKAGRGGAYPSSVRAEDDPRGQSEFTNMSASKLEINQMVFDGFATPATVKKQRYARDVVNQKYRAARQELMQQVIEVYLAAWQNMEVMKAGVVLVTDIQNMARKVNMQAEAGAENQTVKSFVDAKKTAALRTLLQAQNAYRDSVLRLAFFSKTDYQPETFSLIEANIPKLESLETYQNLMGKMAPGLLQEAYQEKALRQELKKLKADYYPTVSLVGEVEETNDLGGSVGNARNGMAVVQVSYKIFDGMAGHYQRARVKEEIAEKQYAYQRFERELNEDVSQLLRQVLATQEEADITAKEMAATMKVQRLRLEETLNGDGDMVRLIEAMEAVWAARVKYMGILADLAKKRYEIAIKTGQLDDEKCFGGGCAGLEWESLSTLQRVPLFAR